LPVSRRREVNPHPAQAKSPFFTFSPADWARPFALVCHHPYDTENDIDKRPERMMSPIAIPGYIGGRRRTSSLNSDVSLESAKAVSVKVDDTQLPVYMAESACRSLGGVREDGWRKSASDCASLVVPTRAARTPRGPVCRISQVTASAAKAQRPTSRWLRPVPAACVVWAVLAIESNGCRT